jgi:ankyrin repeat protein
LQRGANIEATDKLGLTALIVAACNCAINDMPDAYDSLRVLLEAGANVEIRDQQGRVAIMAAAGWVASGLGRPH